MKGKIFSILAIVSIGVGTVSASFENANYLAEKGIIVDKSATPSEYRLKNNILRQEAGVIALGVYGGIVENNCRGIFRDVSATKPNSWACKTIEALEKYDIISDDNLYFRPEENITKSEVLGMLVKAAFDSEYDYDAKNISTKGNWQKQVVDFSVSKGIVNNFYDYNALATREFVFEIGANILKYKENKNSGDDSIFNVNVLDRYQSSNSTTSVKITETEAKNIALKNADLKETEVYGLYVKTDYEKGKLYYDVEFFQNNTTKKFEYKIDSENGKIVEFDIDYKTRTTTNSTAKITETEAKNIALKSAGLKATEIYGYYSKLDYENGKLVYDIEFYQNNTNKKFDYEIDSTNGNILKSSVEEKNSKKSTNIETTTSTTKITETEAKNIALEAAGLKEAEVSGLYVKTDYEKGKLYYEVEFYKNNSRKNYEYKIDSTNGKIVEFDIEND